MKAVDALRRIIFISGLLSVLILSGCESVPFQKTPDFPLDSADPVVIRERFQRAIPEKVRLLNTIVFDYKWKKFSGIGFVEADSSEKTCSVVCMNQVGIKLFELSIDGETTDTRFALPEFTSRGNFSKAVGEDLRRVHFDLVPSAAAEVERTKLAVIFRQQEGKGTVEYVFSGPDRFLTEKTYFEDGNPVWKVSFYEYIEKDGKIYPGGTVLKNYLYDYRLIIKLKEISD
jgi:hypothetical protein